MDYFLSFSQSVTVSSTTFLYLLSRKRLDRFSSNKVYITDRYIKIILKVTAYTHFFFFLKSYTDSSVKSNYLSPFNDEYFLGRKFFSVHSSFLSFSFTLQDKALKGITFSTHYVYFLFLILFKSSRFARPENVFSRDRPGHFHSLQNSHFESLNYVYSCYFLCPCFYFVQEN